MEREFDQHVLAANLKETGIFKAFGEAAVNAIFTANAANIDFHTHIRRLPLHLLITTHNIVLVILKARGLKMGSEYHFLVTHRS